MEGRAPVALPTDEGVYVGWRLRADDPADIAFHVYRDGERITKEPVTGATNLVDPDGDQGSTYRVAEVTQGVQTWATPEVTPWAADQRDVPIQRPTGGTTPDGVAYTYSANDASVADLDGDGEYEIVVKWDPSNAKDNSQSGYTGNVYLDAYKLNGTRLWRINLGRNIRAGAHYTQFLVVRLRLRREGRGEVQDRRRHRSRHGRRHRRRVARTTATPPATSCPVRSTSPCSTATPAPRRDTVDYTPAARQRRGLGRRLRQPRGPLPGGRRLPGRQPPERRVHARGYYTRAVLAAWDWRGGQLTRRWVFDTDSARQPVHAARATTSSRSADVDGDSRDEIVLRLHDHRRQRLGALHTGLGHGDALHVGDLDPGRAGLEVFAVHESPGSNGNRAATFRDARTGQVLWSASGTSDTGRGAAARHRREQPRRGGVEQRWVTHGRRAVGVGQPAELLAARSRTS